VRGGRRRPVPSPPRRGGVCMFIVVSKHRFEGVSGLEQPRAWNRLIENLYQ
jgi:hypothetical protein